MTSPLPVRPPRRAAAHDHAAQAAALALLGAFAALFVAVRTDRSARLDLALTLRLQRHRSPWLVHAMRVVSWPGFPPQSRVIPPLIALGLWLRRLRTEAAFALLAWGAALLCSLVKLVMRRPRPAGPGLRVTVANLRGSSFPSGHTMAYVGVYGFLAYLAHAHARPKPLRRALVAAFGALVALVGPSRVYEGHHWPSDVLASYLLGGGYLLGVTALYRRVKGRERWRGPSPALRAPSAGSRERAG